MEIEGVAKQILTGVVSRYGALPKFSFPTLNDLTPLGLTQAVIDCSNSLEACRELKAELNLTVHQLNTIVKSSVNPSAKEVAEDTLGEVQAYSASVDEKATMYNTHLTTLRGLLSAVKKSKTSLGQSVVEGE